MSAKKKIKPIHLERKPIGTSRKLDIAPVIECPVEFVMKIQELGSTATRACMERVRPATAALILWRLAQGISMKRITEETGVCRKSIRQLQLRLNQPLSEQKVRFAALYAQAASEYTELLFEKADRLWENPEQLDSISPDRLAVTVGIMTDHASRLSGMASSVIEHRTGASIEDAAKMIEDAKKRVAEKLRENAIEAEVIPC